MTPELEGDSLSSLEEQIQRAQVGSGDVADAQFAVRPAKWKCLPGNKVFAQVILYQGAFHVFFDSLRSPLRGKRARLGRLLHATQKFERLLEFAVRIARRRRLFELPKFLVEVHAQFATSIRRNSSSATSFPFSPISPAGTTQEGQPVGQGHSEISLRVFSSSDSLIRKSGSLNPTPPG